MEGPQASSTLACFVFVFCISHFFQIHKLSSLSCTQTDKKRGLFLKKLNVALPHDPATALLGMDPRELRQGLRGHSYTGVHATLFTEPQGGNKVNGRQNVVGPHNGTLFSQKKEGSSGTCCHGNGP